MAYGRTHAQLSSLVIAPPLLKADALWKWFGTVRAISDVSIRIKADEIVGLIGPDRSGRSTLLKLLAGELRPNSGKIILDGEDITHLTPDARLWRGVARTAAHLFLDLTALENVLLSGSITRRPLYPRQGGRNYRDEAMATLEFVGIERLANRRASELTPAEQRFLTIAVALTGKPSLLLLDEPAAAMTIGGREALASLIARIRDEGTCVLITGYRMQSLMSVCDRLLVLSDGKIIAEDSPSTIMGDPAVAGAYMGG
jgi:branched-chain amino acid transport system ATP-binding protein